MKDRPLGRTTRIAGLLAPAVAWLIIVPLPTAAAASEVPPLVTDRPDVTESSETVRRGSVQVEAGYGFARFDGETERLDVTAFPSTLVRVGLDPRIELRLEWDGLISESREAGGQRTEETGSGNMALGVKIKLREEQGALPQLAMLVDAVLPTGSQTFRADRIDPAIRLAGSNRLTGRLGLSYNVGVGALTVEEAPADLDTEVLGRYSVALGIGLSERWGAFVEAFGFLPAGD
ncbi:MAG TPA: transporter, partial [Candidatus Polarisedimenticolaceae bacterium]|nr:transporter [Candidatus Polarisedimenticolaceae bacterium]